jgi:RIP homotypic interaction motif
MSSTLNQTQQIFLKWLVEIVRKDRLQEDNLIFFFTKSWNKLTDTKIAEIIPDDLCFSQTTLDILIRKSYLHCSYKDPDGSEYICSLTQEAYQIVDCNFISPPTNQGNNITVNNSTGIQIGNDNEQKNTIESSSAQTKEEKSKISAFLSHPAFLAFVTLLGSAGSAAIINAIFTKK